MDHESISVYPVNNGDPATTDRYLYFSPKRSLNITPEPPVYYELLIAPDYYPDRMIELSDMHFAPLKESELDEIRNLPPLQTDIDLMQEWFLSRGQPALQVSFVPIRRNPITGNPEKLVSFAFNFIEKNGISKSSGTGQKNLYAANSVLRNGRWILIRTTEDGIYRLTYNDLVQMGIENPGNVRIFGNGNRMLPKMNDRERHDDLVENRIYMNKGNDGIFNQGD